MKILRLRGTFVLAKIFGKFLDNSPFVQFSLKEPWLIPKHDDNETRNMFGWLFFYFGYIKK